MKIQATHNSQATIKSYEKRTAKVLYSFLVANTIAGALLKQGLKYTAMAQVLHERVTQMAGTLSLYEATVTLLGKRDLSPILDKHR